MAIRGSSGPKVSSVDARAQRKRSSACGYRPWSRSRLASTPRDSIDRMATLPGNRRNQGLVVIRGDSSTIGLNHRLVVVAGNQIQDRDKNVHGYDSRSFRASFAFEAAGAPPDTSRTPGGDDSPQGAGDGVVTARRFDYSSPADFDGRDRHEDR